jgi:hypothetical protein
LGGGGDLTKKKSGKNIKKEKMKINEKKCGMEMELDKNLVITKISFCRCVNETERSRHFFSPMKFVRYDI